MPDRPWPGRSTTITPEGPCERRRVRAPARPAAGEAVQEQERDRRRRASGPPSGGRRSSTASCRREGCGDRGRRLAVELDVPGRGPSGSAGPGRRADRSRPPGHRAGRPVVTSANSPPRAVDDRPDIDAVGRPEELLVVLGQARPRATSVDACGRNEKIPPPSLSIRTIVADRPWSRAATSALRSCRNDTSPTTSATGPTSAAAAPRAVETTPSMPFAPRLDSGRMDVAAAGEPVVHVPDRHAVAGPQERAVGQEPAERGERQSLERLAACLHVGEPAIGAPRSAARSASHQSRAQPPDARVRRLASSASARSFAVAVASACTNVVGMIAGSLQPRSPSTTIWAGRASSSRVSIGFEVVVAPNRITRSGRCASRHGPGRTRWSAWARTKDRSCGPAADDRTAGRRRSESRSRPRGGRGAAGRAGSSCGPATMSPRSTAARRGGEIRDGVRVEDRSSGDDRR